MIVIRSIVFNLVFYLVLFVYLIAAMPTLLRNCARARTPPAISTPKVWIDMLAFVIVVLVVAAPAFVFGPIIWPPNPHIPAPAGLQLVLFMALAALESLALGLGVAFICYGLPLVRRLASPSSARLPATSAACASAFTSPNWDAPVIYRFLSKS